MKNTLKEMALKNEQNYLNCDYQTYLQENEKIKNIIKCLDKSEQKEVEKLLHQETAMEVYTSIAEIMLRSIKELNLSKKDAIIISRGYKALFNCLYYKDLEDELIEKGKINTSYFEMISEGALEAFRKREFIINLIVALDMKDLLIEFVKSQETKETRVNRMLKLINNYY